MTVYVDVSEARAVSRLHPRLAKTAQQIVGLEAATGADVLISAAEGTLPGNVNRPPGSILLQKHIDSGMLIQRKTGSDALQSITKMHNIIARMRATNCPMNWLLVTGYIFRVPETNKVMVEGRKTEWHWNAWQAALDAWQILGGYTHVEPDDLQAVEWIIRWDAKLPELIKETAQGLAERPMTPKLGLIDPHPERVTLMTFPGCGDTTSMKIMDEFPTLAAALEWMSQPTSFGIPGVGEGTLEAWRKWLGLQSGEVLSRLLLGGPTIHGSTDSEDKRSDEGKLGTKGKTRPVGSTRPDFDGSASIPKQERDNRYGNS